MLCIIVISKKLHPLNLHYWKSGPYYQLTSGRRSSPEVLEKIKFRDNIKYQFCKNNNISLLIIPYYELKNIERILDEFIKTSLIGGL